MKTILNILLLPLKIVVIPIYIILSIVELVTKIVLGIGGCLISVIIFLTVFGLGLVILDTSSFSTELITSTILTILFGLFLSLLFALANNIMTFLTKSLSKFISFWF